MANALVCDRCRKTILLDGDGGAEVVCLSNPNSRWSGESSPRWDFCTECWEAFLSFAETEPVPKPNVPDGLDFHWHGETTQMPAVLWVQGEPRARALVRAQGETFSYAGSTTQRRCYLIEADA